MKTLLNKFHSGFIFTSFLGQGLSYGKLYASHIVALPFLALVILNLNDLKNALKDKSLIIPGMFFLWCLLGLVLHPAHYALKYFAIFSFGFLQYLSTRYLEKERERKILSFIFILSLIELFIGLGESFGLWRFPISDLNPMIELFGKKSSFFFHELIPHQVEYLNSTPTGLRWGSNNFIFYSFILLTYFSETFQNKYYLPLLALVSFLCVSASARLLFWTGFPIVGIFLIHKKDTRKGIMTLTIPLIIALVFLLGNDVQINKGREVLSLPLSVLKLFTTFEEKVVASASLKADVISVANQRSSEASRYVYLKSTWKIFLRSPIWGSGPGASYIDPQTGENYSPHFYLMEIAANFGTVGALLYLLFLFVPLYQCWSSRQPLFGFSLTMTVMFLLGGVIVSSLTYFPVYWLTLGHIHGKIYNLEKI